MKSNKKEAARRKLLKLMPRKVLESLAQSDRPHMLTISELITHACGDDKWNGEEVEIEIERLLILANGGAK